jgi:tetratricopeptide (TPR) repeat protein
MHQAILRGELRHPADGPVPASAPQSPAPPPPPPAQLPLDVYGFTGRQDQLARLDALMASDDQPTAVVIAAVSGTAGVGKTALAVHWAHQVRDRFKDGQLYVNLRGFDSTGPAMDPAEAIRRFLDALHVPAQRIPADLDAQAAHYRTLLADRRMLILLDNARDADQVRPLLPGAPGCLVLITSRNRLTGLLAAEGAHLVALDLLTVDEARDLLARRLGAARVGTEADAVDELVAHCARLPLALAIVAANAAARPRTSLAALGDQLRDAQDRLDALSTGDTPATDARAVFSWSYQALGEDSARLFRLLGLHPGPDISVPAAASLAALPIGDVRRLLNQLAGAHLIHEPTPGRYTFHDLLRTYATDLAQHTDPDGQRHAAIHRVLDHYLHTADTAAHLLGPTRDPITVALPPTDATVEHLANRERALAWFTAEHPVLLAVIEHAPAAGFDTHTWQLAWTLAKFLEMRGHWREQAATWTTALAAARRLANPTAQAHANHYLGRSYHQLRRFDEAHTHLWRALDLYRQTRDQVGQAHTHHILGGVRAWQGRHADALACFRRAFELHRVAGHQWGQASALNAVGWSHATLGEYQQAESACWQALTLLQQLGHRYGQAATWDSLGYVHHQLGHHAEATTCYRHALDLYWDLGDRWGEVTVLSHLGDTHRATRDFPAARDAYQQALVILDGLALSDAEQIRDKLLELDLDLAQATVAVQDRDRDHDPVRPADAALSGGALSGGPRVS